jgi:hypothetical protein
MSYKYIIIYLPDSTVFDTMLRLLTFLYVHGIYLLYSENHRQSTHKDHHFQSLKGGIYHRVRWTHSYQSYLSAVQGQYNVLLALIDHLNNACK